MAKTILTKNQSRLLKEISKDKNFSKYFYLTGGTALSEFFLHHRLSEDLDFFSEQEIDQSWLTTLVTNITDQLSIKSVDRREIFNRNLVFFNFTQNLVKTEFTYFPSPQIEKPKLIGGIPIDSEIDIAANKLFTVYQKPSARHFIDLYLLLKKYSWDKLEKLARVKFDTNIDPIQLGSQLIKAKDIMDLPKMLVDVPEKDWRDFFIRKAKELKSVVF